MYSQIDSNKRKTWFLVIGFVIVVMFIGWIVAQFTEIGPGGLVIAGVFSLGMSLTSYFASDKIALASAGAKGPISEADNAYVYRMVENLSIASGTPMPRVYLIADPAINAFATGRDPKHAAIAVTTGAIEKLENEELEGVLAHELSHVKNYDIRLLTVVVVLVGFIALLSDWFLRAQLFGGRNRSDNDSGKAGSILMIVGVVLLILSPIIGELIKLAVSRKREFLADASGALITRYPEGLARALEKIAAEKLPLRHANTATAHLYISSPFGNRTQSLKNLFSTHPPIAERIAQLRKMA
jgi:heat shock protein HtpX